MKLSSGEPFVMPWPVASSRPVFRLMMMLPAQRASGVKLRSEEMLRTTRADRAPHGL